MKTKNLKLSLLFAGALLALPVLAARAEEPAAGAPGNEGIQWREPTPAIREIAKASNKLILADFYADWCGVCKKQDATSYQDDRVILMTDQVVATKINEETNRGMIGQYNIKGYPTVVLLTADGTEVKRVAGAYNPDGYVQWLGGILYDNALPNINAALEQKPDDIKLLTITALIHSAANRKDQVPTMLNKAGDAAVAKFNAGEKIERDNAGQMARTFRLLSLYFQSQQDYERGAASLHYLTQLSTRPREVVAARIALAEDFFQTNQSPKAVAELESLLKVETITAQERQSAVAKLESYKKVPG